MKKILAWFSCGVTSAIACKLAIEQYGVENVDVVYIGIKSAHEDNERFIADCEKWFNTKIKTIRSQKYDDQFEVIEETGYVNGAGGARCTVELKKIVRFDYQKLHNYEQVFGFEHDVKQINCAIRFGEQFPDVNPRFPLIEQSLNKPMCADIILMNGIALPVMYILGYENNNCIGCVKGGKGYWNKIRIDFPSVFAKMAVAERNAGHSCIREKIRENGKVIGSRSVFLDELKPNDGNKLKPIVPDCGSLCEIKFTDIIDPRAKDIYQNPNKIKQLYLF